MAMQGVYVDGGEPLLDAVCIEHGPRRPLSQFFLLAERSACEIGIQVRVHADLSSLAEANLKLQESWGPLVPTYNPAASDLTPETAFWLSAHDPTGALVATTACRRFDLVHTGFDEEFTSLRVFYADPAPYAARGMFCSVEDEAAKSARSIRGVVNFAGAHWARPDYRGRGIVYLFTRINRFLGLARWNCYYTTGVSRVDLLAKQALAPYGYQHSDRVIRVRNSYRGDFDMSFVWMDRAWMERDLDIYLAANVARV